MSTEQVGDTCREALREISEHAVSMAQQSLATAMALHKEIIAAHLLDATELEPGRAEVQRLLRVMLDNDEELYFRIMNTPVFSNAMSDICLLAYRATLPCTGKVDE